ncbi:MAG TPA: ABC transporter permease [Herpetosiphonaceae bacterium]|nr:ABC transporter permease [Herpetosiphonaceae bacterium]
MRYVLRRIGFYAVAAWASLTLNFILPRLMPGDPSAAIFARFRGQLQPDQIQAMKEAFGFTDAPLIQQYFTYVSHAIRGDFGVSVSAFPAKVTSVIGNGLVWTLLIGITALIISFGLGSLLGIVSAWKRGSKLDNIFPPLLIFLGSFPFFWLAMVALYFLAFKAGWFPLRHAYSDRLSPAFSWAFISSVISHLILPALSIVLVSIGGWVLGMRNTMINVLGEDYITLASAKGLSTRRVMFNYAARNALLPNITAFGMALGFVLGGQIIVETVFSYPGLGYLLIRAVSNLDYPLMQGIFLMITLAVLGANLIVDLLYVRLDPRVRGS